MKGQTLENMGNNWQSIDEWKLKAEGEMFYIENSSNNKVLGATIDGKVVEEDFVGGKGEQLWSKHVINNDGIFTLKNSEAQKLLTANPNGLKIRGINLFTTSKIFVFELSNFPKNFVLIFLIILYNIF